MKKLALVSVVATLVACSSSPKQAEVYRSPVPTPTQQKIAVVEAPAWMSQLPKEEGYVYENGTSTSQDFSMADMKAKTMAYSKICVSAGGKIRSQMKMFKSDVDGNSSENVELAVRSMCPDVDMTGVETVEMKHISDGSDKIRTYVLVRLPTGSHNVLKSTKDAQRRAPEAFRELDSVTDDANKTERAPVRPVAPASAPVSQVKGVDLELLDVNNAEYRARRDEALQKPGAVVGRATLN
jgi:hypothetical protein